jgi:hypothetical protein
MTIIAPSRTSARAINSAIAMQGEHQGRCARFASMPPEDIRAD